MLSPSILYEANDNDIDVDLIMPGGGDATVITDASPMFSLGSNEDGENGLITGISNASPPVVTASNHGLTNGTTIIIHGVKSLTQLNGTYVVQNVTTNTFDLYETDGVTAIAAPGTYTTGGVWRKAISGASELALAHSSTIDGRYSNYIPATADVRNQRTYTGILYDAGIYAGKILLVQTNVRGRTRQA